MHFFNGKNVYRGSSTHIDRCILSHTREAEEEKLLEYNAFQRERSTLLSPEYFFPSTFYIQVRKMDFMTLKIVKLYFILVILF